MSSANGAGAGLKYWSDDVYSDHPIHSYAYYAGIYGLLQICAMISLLLLGIALFIVSVKRAGANLHQDALRTLIQAPLGFFTKTDTGIVTNLFSQDLNLIDTELPNALLNTLFSVSEPYMTYSHLHWPAATCSLVRLFMEHIEEKSTKQFVDTLGCNTLIHFPQVFQAIGQAAVMLTSSGFFAISYPFLAVLLYIVQRFYLRTSRQLRLLDLEAKSPL